METNLAESFTLFTPLWQSTLQWEPSSRQLSQFLMLYDRVLIGNQVQNLTRITEPPDFWEKHLWDSLRGVQRWAHHKHLRAIDIGTGAGFPGLPIAIAQPTWQVTLLDSTLKKVKFVENTISHLELPKARAIHGRAEELCRHPQFAKRFDLVLIRAVGSVTYCLTCALPFLRSGGTVVLYRGQWTVAEEALLVGKKWEIDTFTTPITQSVRNCIYIL